MKKALFLLFTMMLIFSIMSVGHCLPLTNANTVGNNSIDLTDEQLEWLEDNGYDIPVTEEELELVIKAGLPASDSSEEVILFKKGSKGEEVKEIQTYLNNMGYSVGKADGSFGAKTEAGVKAFQKDYDLPVTGIVDNDTYQKIVSYGVSILNDERIKKLINKAPYILKVDKNTADLYDSIAKYNEAYQHAGYAHTWKIWFQGGGTVVFSDENSTVLFTFKNKGKAPELAPVLEWQVEVLRLIPEFATYAEKHGIYFTAEMLDYASTDCSKYTDASGTIDLLDKEKYEGVLGIKEDDLSLLKTMAALAEAFG